MSLARRPATMESTRPAVAASPARSGRPSAALSNADGARRALIMVHPADSLDSAETLASSNRLHRIFLPLAPVRSTCAADGDTSAFEKKNAILTAILRRRADSHGRKLRRSRLARTTTRTAFSPALPTMAIILDDRNPDLGCARASKRLVARGHYRRRGVAISHVSRSISRASQNRARPSWIAILASRDRRDSRSSSLQRRSLSPTAELFEHPRRAICPRDSKPLPLGPRYSDKVGGGERRTKVPPESERIRGERVRHVATSRSVADERRVEVTDGEAPPGGGRGHSRRVCARARARGRARGPTSTSVGCFRCEMSGHSTMATTMAATSTRMYPVRPVVVLPSKCGPHSGSMYEMRNVHEDRRDDRRRRHDAADTAAKMPDDVVTQASLPEYGALEARQEKILSQLAELKKQVSRLCYFLKQSNQMEVTKDFVAIQKPVFVQLLLNVNPNKPPYSILALQKLWKDTNFRVKSYIHSTINGQIPIVFPQITKSTANIIELTLIWKEVSSMEVVTNLHSCPIKGEANFLRYVSRLIESHNYESTCLQPHTLDFALDFANLLHNEQCIEKGLLILADEFEKWSCKGGFNIVDIAVWSLIKQFPGTSLPPALRKWYALCEKTFTEETSDSLMNHDK